MLDRFKNINLIFFSIDFSYFFNEVLILLFSIFFLFIWIYYLFFKDNKNFIFIFTKCILSFYFFLFLLNFIIWFQLDFLDFTYPYSNFYLVRNAFLFFSIYIYVHYLNFIEIKTKFLTVEVLFLINFAVFFFLMLMSSKDLLSFYLNLEGLSFIMVFLLSFNFFSRKALEGSIKYFILSIISSIFLLFSFCLLFLLTKSIEIDTIILSLNTINNKGNSINSYFYLLFFFSGIFFLLSFFFKLALVPFHFWLVEIYESASYFILIFYVCFIKFFFFLVFLKFFFFFNSELIFNQFILVVSILSITIGTLGAIQQVKIKRLLAYIAINQMGFSLLPLYIGNLEAYQISIFFVFIYNLLFFFLILVLSQYNLNQKYKKLIFLSDLTFIFSKNKLFGFILLIFFFTFLGLPPFLGFFTKIMVLKFLIQNVSLFLFFLIIIGLLISSFYYLKLIKIIFFDNYLNTINYNQFYISIKNSYFILLNIFFFNLFFIFFFKYILSFFKTFSILWILF